MEDLKKEVIAAVLAGDVEQMQKLKLKLWMRKPRKKLFDRAFIEWVNSDEGKSIRAHLEETY